MIFMPSFDLQKYLEIIQEFKVTRSAVVPPIVLGLAKHPMVDKYDLKSLKALMSGAAPLGGDIQKACADRLGCIVKQAWGMTEISPCGTITPDDEIVSVEFIKGKSGVLAPETEAKIVKSLLCIHFFLSNSTLMLFYPQTIVV
jgi:acyl-CoA synthetase (AMP-forming)/AMP-acid ligase II